MKTCYEWREDYWNAPKDGSIFIALVEYEDKRHYRNGERFVDVAHYEKDVLTPYLYVLRSHSHKIRGKMIAFCVLDIPTGVTVK